MAGWLALLLVLTATAGETLRPDVETFFELKVRPLLIDSCLRCHGGDHGTCWSVRYWNEKRLMALDLVNSP
jgi:hypothetical protein